jgi:predicted neuraminidase
MMLQRLLSLVAAVLVLFCAVATVRAPGWPATFVAPPAAPACTGRSVFTIGKFHTAFPDYAHVLSAVNLRDGRIRAVWYEGSAELQPDVRIMTATYDGRKWSTARAIIDAPATSEALGRYVRRLGNVTIYRDSRGDLVLIFASVGIGGWSGANLNLMRSRDDGETWSPPRRLTTMATFNFATNVRAPAVAAAGGLTLVPTSHEFPRRYPALMLLDEDGRVFGKRRIGLKYQGIQPFVLVLDEQRAVAFFRTRYDHLTPSSRTDYAGFSWSEPEETSVRNYDKPVAIGRLGGKRYFMIHNFVIPKEIRGALTFMLELSEDEGRTWRPIGRLDFQLDRKMQAKYPWLMVGPDDHFHLLFTLGTAKTGSELIHARFNRDWIAAKAGLPCS